MTSRNVGSTGKWNETRERQFVEDVGVLFEQQGIPRMAGRVLGRLLVCMPPYQSLPDLAAYLKASMGSLSTTTRFLEQIGMIERIAVPGERKAQFRVNSSNWNALMDDHFEHIRRMGELAERGLELIGPRASRARREQLEEMRDIAILYEQRFPELRAKWAASPSRTVAKRATTDS